jgi:hypothetical protein
MNYSKDDYVVILDALNQVLFDDIYWDNSKVLLAIDKTEKIIESLNQQNL